MNKHFRVQFLIFSIVISLTVDAFGQYASNSKPNIFIYISDDQNSWDYEIFGNKQVKTKNFDRLVTEGLRFSNAYTSQAVCAHSRSQ